jgi:hypothetical protein
MRNTLQRFRAAYVMELRLLCLRRSYGLLHLLWAGLLIYVARGIVGTAHTALEGTLGRLVTSLLSLVACFVAGASASRNERTRFGALDDALPTGAEALLGRWLAVGSALLAFLVAPLAMAAALGPGRSFLAGAPAFVLETLIALLFAATFAFWLIGWLGGRGRWVYLLLAGIWFGCNFGPEFLMDVTGVAPLELMRFGRTQTRLYSELWGRLQDGVLPVWFNLFYVGLTLGFLALIVWRTQTRRLHRRPTLPGLALLAAFALTATSGARYVQAMDARIGDIDVDARFSADAPPDQQAAMPPEKITSYDVEADLRNPDDPSFIAKLTIRNTGSAPLERLTFTLNHDLEVTDTGVPFERYGDALWLTPPQPLAPHATTEVQIGYRGTLWQGIRRYDGVPEAIFFTDARGVRLATAAGWYPLAGRVPLHLQYADMQSGNYLHPPAPFRLKLQAPDRLTFVSNLPRVGPNLYVAPDATWMFLVGSPEVAVEQVENVTLMAARDDLPQLRPTAQVYGKVLRDLLRFLPDMRIDNLTLAAFDGTGFPWFPGPPTPPVAGQPLVVNIREDLAISPEAAHKAPARLGSVASSLFADLWVPTLHRDTSPPEPARSLVGTFLGAYVVAKGNPRLLRQAYMERGNGLEPDLDAFLTIYEQRGEAATVAAITRLRRNAAAVDAMDAAQRRAWILEGAHAN